MSHGSDDVFFCSQTQAEGTCVCVGTDGAVVWDLGVDAVNAAVHEVDEVGKCVWRDGRELNGRAGAFQGETRRVFADECLWERPSALRDGIRANDDLEHVGGDHGGWDGTKGRAPCLILW